MTVEESSSGHGRVSLLFGGPFLEDVSHGKKVHSFATNEARKIADAIYAIVGETAVDPTMLPYEVVVNATLAYDQGCTEGKYEFLAKAFGIGREQADALRVPKHEVAVKLQFRYSGDGECEGAALHTAQETAKLLGLRLKDGSWVDGGLYAAAVFVGANNNLPAQQLLPIFGDSYVHVVVAR